MKEPHTNSPSCSYLFWIRASLSSLAIVLNGLNILVRPNCIGAVDWMKFFIVLPCIFHCSSVSLTLPTFFFSEIPLLIHLVSILLCQFIKIYKEIIVIMWYISIKTLTNYVWLIKKKWHGLFKLLFVFSPTSA